MSISSKNINTDVGIDLIEARRLFMDIPSSVILENTGESLLLEKRVINILFLLSPLFVVFSILWSFYFFKYYGIIIFIVAPLIYFLNMGASSKGSLRITSITFFLILTIASNFLKNVDYRFTGLLSLITFSFWCTRYLYKIAGKFVENFAIRNTKAFEWLSEYNVIYYGKEYHK